MYVYLIETPTEQGRRTAKQYSRRLSSGFYERMRMHRTDLHYKTTGRTQGLEKQEDGSNFVDFKKDYLPINFYRQVDAGKNSEEKQARWYHMRTDN